MPFDSRSASPFSQPSDGRRPNMSPHPAPVEGHKHPPLLQRASSSSSTCSLEGTGLEQAVPSFRHFVQQNPSPDTRPDHVKPLPPMPLMLRGDSSASNSGGSTYSGRRTSSVYSRTLSQWFANDDAWQREDSNEGSLHPGPVMLRPLAYSASAPHLPSDDVQDTLLEARVYQPLIATPSPTDSRVTSPSPAPGQRREGDRAALQSTPLASATVPKPYPHTISLENANAVLHAPGALRLLPEELRAKTTKSPTAADVKGPSRSRSHATLREHVRMDSMDILAGAIPRVPQMPSTLVDRQGRHRSVLGPMFDVGQQDALPIPAASRAAARPGRSLGNSAQRQTPTRTQQHGARLNDGATKALHFDEIEEEPRGRTRQRGTRHRRNAPQAHADGQVQSRHRGDGETALDGRTIATDYHQLLAKPREQQPTSRSPDSQTLPLRMDGSSGDRSSMKTVPRSLFHDGTSTSQSASGPTTCRAPPLGLRNASSDSAGTDDSSMQGAFPLRLSISTLGRRNSSSARSGSIPITMLAAEPHPAAFGRDLSRQPSDAEPLVRAHFHFRRNSDDNRVSVHLPRIAMRDAPSAQHPNRPHATSPPISGQLFPSPSAGAFDHLFRPSPTPASIPPEPLSPITSTPRSRAHSRPRDNIDPWNPQKQHLLSRLTGNAVRYGDLVARAETASAAADGTAHSSSPPAASKKSPMPSPAPARLPPTPLRSSPTGSFSGWKDKARGRFERKHAFAEAETRSPPLGSPASPGSAAKAFFGGIRSGWKEGKAEQRREDLKRAIRVVPRENLFSGPTRPIEQ